jgi:PAS domain S-box-containing protein
MRSTDEADYMREACKIIVQDCGYTMVWAGFAEEDEARSIRPVASAGFEDGYIEGLKLTWADTERGRGPTGTAIRTGRVCHCLNMLTSPAFEPWRGEAVKRGYASSVALPLTAGGRTFGALSVYAREPEAFTEDEVKLLTDLATDFAQGVMSLRVRAAQERAEKAVRESEERYRTLFSTMTEGFALHEIVCDERGKPCDYRFLDMNPAFERLTGLKREDVVGRTVRDVMPRTESIWIERYGRVALTGEPDHFEHASADLGRHYEVNVYRTAPRRFAVIFDDITELRAMQAREKEDAIRLAWGQSAIDTINAMHEGVALLGIDGTITTINPAVERMTGLTGGAVVGRNLETVLPEFLEGHDLGIAQHGLALLRRGEMPVLPPLRLKRPDGKAFRVLPSVSLMDAPEGGQRVAILTLKDVTDLHEAAQRLEQSERKYRELVENANSIIMRITPDHIITFFNEYAQTFFGYGAREVVGRSVIGTIVPEMDSEGRDLREMMRAIETSPEQHAGNENENMCKDGRQVWVHWANRAVRDREGRITEILCVGTDITRRREVEAEARRYQERLRSLAERLATAEEEERWQISRYIHDTIIQNLSLASIKLGPMREALAKANLPDEVARLGATRTLIENAVAECRSVMTDLTPALLYDLGLVPALTDLAGKLREQHGVAIRVEERGQGKPMDRGLRGLLFQAARELVINALKHAAHSDIHIRVIHEDNEVVVSVRDDGPGFDPAMCDRHEDGRGGFGLFSVRERVEGFGGRLTIDSAAGKGATATIAVPTR